MDDNDLWNYMVLLILLIVLLCFILGILIIPVFIVIDSRQNLLEIRLWKILQVKMEVFLHDPFFNINLNFLGYKKAISLFKVKKKKVKIPESDPVKMKKKRKPKNVLKLVKSILKSFRVKHLQLSVDTGDYLKNAYLYPFFYGPRFGKNISLTVNNKRVNYLFLEVSNRPIKIAWAVLKHIQ